MWCGIVDANLDRIAAESDRERSRADGPRATRRRIRSHCQPFGRGDAHVHRRHRCAALSGGQEVSHARGGRPVRYAQAAGGPH
jgi:hypothetical protein